MPNLDDEKRFIESGSIYKVNVPRSKGDWEGRWEYFSSKKDANRTARKHGLKSFYITVPTLQEIPVYAVDEEDDS